MPQISKPNSLNKIWAAGGDRATPLDGKISSGWQIEIPPRQWFNWLDNRQDQAIAHFNQHGIPVWDDQTEYQAGKSYVQDPGNKSEERREGKECRARGAENHKKKKNM